MLYRGTRDNFTRAKFDDKIKNHTSLVFILKSDQYNRIFGAYTDIPFDDRSKNIILNKKTFLFSLRDDKSIVKLTYK